MTTQENAKTATDVAKAPLKQVTSVRHLLVNEQAREQLALVAAKHIIPDRMMRLMANSVRTTPRLADCDPLSLLGALMTCASLGLEPNTVLGHAYLIPFGNKRKGITEVQLVIGYKGLVDLARRSGHIVSIHADIAYEGDQFEFEYGSNQHLSHRPRGLSITPEYAYAHAKLTDGEAFIVWPYRRVLEIRDASEGYKKALRDLEDGKKWLHDKSPWIAHESAMAAKTMVRQLAKMLPLSIEMATAVAVDENVADYRSYAVEGTNGAGPAIIDDAVYSAVGDDDAVAESDEGASDVDADQKQDGKPEPDAKVKGKTTDKPEAEEADSAPSDGDEQDLETLVQEIEQSIAECSGKPKAVAQVMEKLYAKEIKALPDELRTRVLDAAMDAGYGAEE